MAKKYMKGLGYAVAVSVGIALSGPLASCEKRAGHTHAPSASAPAATSTHYTADPYLIRQYLDRLHDAHSRRQNHDAIEYATKLLKMGYDDNASVYLIRAEARARLRDENGAIEDYTIVIHRHPTWYGGYSLRASVYLSLEQWDRAVADFTKALELNPPAEEAAFLLGQRSGVYHSRGDHELAEKDYERMNAIQQDLREKEREGQKER